MANASIRRVVTGTSAAGKSVVVSDSSVEPMTIAMMPGAEFLYFWGDDTMPVYPDPGVEPPYKTCFQQPAAMFELITVPPELHPEADRPRQERRARRGEGEAARADGRDGA